MKALDQRLGDLEFEELEELARDMSAQNNRDGLETIIAAMERNVQRQQDDLVRWGTAVELLRPYFRQPGDPPRGVTTLEAVARARAAGDRAAVLASGFPWRTDTQRATTAHGDNQ